MSSLPSPCVGGYGIPLAAHRVAVKLGLGLLVYPRPCHGYANGCACEGCSDRADRMQALRDAGWSPDLAAREAVDDRSNGVICTKTIQTLP